MPVNVKELGIFLDNTIMKEHKIKLIFIPY